MIDVSIIVPLYKGEKYVDSIIENIELCMMTTNILVEIIFVNDYPRENLIHWDGKKCNCLFLHNERNIGIHASRVRGLKKASGKYVVFLDQDDYFCEDYLTSQLDNIKDADASVCRLMNGDREHYTDSFKLEDVVSKEFMMSKWCSIVSPGQVLIKRNAIPEIWKTNIIENNGADDYFLWLAMFFNGSKFVVNDELLFYHTVNGFNTSSDTNLMMDSEKEVLEILRKSDLLSDIEEQKMKELEVSLTKAHIKQLDNICSAYYLMNILNNINSELVDDYLGTQVGIYGAADIGYVIYNWLKDNHKINLCFIDRNAKFIEKKYLIYLPNEIPKSIDSIIIAVRGKQVVDEIKLFLKNNVKCKVFDLNELVMIIEREKTK